MKHCKFCKKDLDDSLFTKDKNQSGGLYPKCRNCGKIDYLNNLDENRTKSRNYMRDHIDERRIYKKKYIRI